VIVDYANDQIDLRLQSKAADGVPDHIVLDMADCVVGLVQTTRHHIGPMPRRIGETPDQVVNMMKKTRCAWAGDDPLSIAYHDEEWGVHCTTIVAV